MNTIADKLATAENQVNEILEQWSPLTSRLEELDRELAGVSETIAKLSRESQALREGIGAARQGLEQVLVILAETKTEGADLTAKQAENEHLCGTLTSMFGEAFQVVSRFLETAQRIGIIDKTKTQEILNPTSAQDPVTETPVVEEVAEPVTETPVVEEVAEPVTETPVVEEVAEPVAETPMVEEVAEPVAETPIVEDTVGEQLAGILERELPETSPETELETPAMPGLPDVTSATDALPPVDDADAETEDKSPEEIASQLDLPPLQLGASSDTLEDGPSEEEEQRIEDLLTDLTKPISTE